jgi:hypothetical protein
MQVTSSTSISFPKLGWGISAGETKELPKDKAAQERILAEDGVSVVKENGKEDRLDG